MYAMNPIDRRVLLKGAGIVVAGAVARGMALLLGQAGHFIMPSPAPVAAAQSESTASVDLSEAFGVDSCTSVAHGTAGGMPLQFYIGELGATRYGAGCFNVATARYVAAIRTHGYWGLCGPKSRPATLRDAASFGQSQAVAAIRAWNNNPAVGGRTLFADVEAGFGGWGAPLSPADNVALLDGFLLTIASAGFVPGVYINESDKTAWFPADYAAAAPFVYWVAGGRLSGTMPGPCHAGDTTAPVRAAWSSAVGRETFGGMKAVIWQYWLSPLGCVGDFNYSPQSGRARFTPQPA